ncbi:MAG TPA: EAL domain-containing protein [Streptosporangiaceae bacterium]|jgi:diguanylate cyclase (GGDEF)-like protein|nr:EAL domain-containing protein [Streptosporangiaceae bacterium]
MNERSPAGRSGWFATDWASALIGSANAADAASAALSPGAPGEIAELLAALAADTLSVAHDLPFQPEQAAKIGAALVDANLVDPAVLGRSLTVIGRHLSADSALAADRDRVAAVQEAVASGYVRALRDRTRAETQRHADELRRGAEARFQAELRHQARHDPLTGVANRTLFLDQLAAAVAPAAPGRRLGLCYLDLDGFTSVNDAFGHDVGDELLIAVAGRLQERIDPGCGLVARIGGDEFILLIEPSGGLDAMIALASDVLTVIERPFRIGRHRIGLTASVGVVERPAAGTGVADLVKDADSALYRAKAEGPGRWVVYDPAVQAADSARMALTTSIRSALEAGEFTVVYQPIVTLPGGELRGVEALLRWDHPTLGTLAPESFIEPAESSGAINPLGRWVMETACAQAAEWYRVRPDGAPFISVNLSPQQATDPGFVAEVARIMTGTGLPARLLQLELTESALVGADSRPLRTLEKLSAMGVRIAADDFGSGYSNLAYLRRLPVGSLKLSASFIKELWPDGPADEPVISALAGLAHRLGLDVTVEGVETREQARQLFTLGCDSAQGWYYAAAVPGRDITAVLRDSAPLNFPRATLPHG